MFVVIPLIGNIKVCMFSFQVTPTSHLIKTLIFRYREEIPIFYPFLNILLMNFRKTFVAVTQTAVHTHIIFLPSWKRVPCRIVVRAFVCQTRVRVSKPHYWSFAFYYFLKFSGWFLVFSKNFLDFTTNISELFRKVTDKF